MQNVVLLVAANKVSWLFLSDVEANAEEQHVEDYLKGKNINVLKCEKMQTRKDKYQSSFRIEVQSEDKIRAMESELWPKRLIINHFMNIQRRAQDTKETCSRN